MHENQSLTKIERMSDEDRYLKAQEKTQKIVDAFLAHLRTHENNQYVTYSSIIADQIPKSYAGNAFAALQSNLLEFELIRLASFWENVDLDGFSLPTIAKLSETTGVSEIVQKRHHQHYTFHKEYAEEAKSKAKLALDQAIENTGKFHDSESLENLKNFRHRLSHLLETTNIEKKKRISPPKYGDEREILEITMSSIDKFHSALNGVGFDWDGANEMNRRNAKSFWEGVTIKVLK
jgi:hypothetical protein